MRLTINIGHLVEKCKPFVNYFYNVWYSLHFMNNKTQNIIS